MTDTDLLNIVTCFVIIDRATMDKVYDCQHAGLDILTACRNLYGWDDPGVVIARGEMNAVQFVQALQLARAQRDRQARQ